MAINTKLVYLVKCIQNRPKFTKCYDISYILLEFDLSYLNIIALGYWGISLSDSSLNSIYSGISLIISKYC